MAVNQETPKLSIALNGIVLIVEIYGGRQKAIEVRLNPEACKALNLTASKISGLLSQNPFSLK